MPPNQKFPSFGGGALNHNDHELDNDGPVTDPTPQMLFRCAVLGCGMMGQEHVSYIMGYPKDVRIDFLADPVQSSLDDALNVMNRFRAAEKMQEEKKENQNCVPTLLHSEDELFQHAHDIDLLIIATPNYLHTDSLVKWSKQDITILVEKPVAVSADQLEQLQAMTQNSKFQARVFVAMEYRFIPAIAKLFSLVPNTIGDLKMITIRENRYPFLHKIGTWNRDPEKTGDTLVEKCCHFFDLFRLITGQEIVLPKVRALAQRGINYQDETPLPGITKPIIDAAYVTMPFQHRQGQNEENDSNVTTGSTIGCLELNMYAEGSRHQEEIIVTGTKGRLEAYLPENKVFAFERPSQEEWQDRAIPPPPESIRRTVYDCSNVKDIHGIEQDMPTHGGYHYSSTAVEWFHLLGAMRQYTKTGLFVPQVSLDDGIQAVRAGLQASAAIVNEESG